MRSMFVAIASGAKKTSEGWPLEDAANPVACVEPANADGCLQGGYLKPTLTDLSNAAWGKMTQVTPSSFPRTNNAHPTPFPITGAVTPEQ